MGPDVFMRISKLREGRGNINGFAGEEIAERVREYHFTRGCGFNRETQGVTDDVLPPYLSLDMQTGLGNRPGGKPSNTSQHQDALLALRDGIASTICLRQNEAPPPTGPRSIPPG